MEEETLLQTQSCKYEGEVSCLVDCLGKIVELGGCKGGEEEETGKESFRQFETPLKPVRGKWYLSTLHLPP